jgi:hypothetical protein
MIVEQRTYSIAPGQLENYLRLYTDGPMELQKRILGNLLGYFATEIGELSSLVHIWGYQSLDDRMERRQRLSQEPAWQAYLQACTPMIRAMENRIMVPTSFSPIR